MDEMTVTMVVGAQLKRFKSLGAMTAALGAPFSEINLVKATRSCYFVYLRGELVGEAVKVRA